MIAFAKSHWIVSLVVVYIVACYVDANVLGLGLGRANVLRGVFGTARTTPPSSAPVDATAAA